MKLQYRHCIQKKKKKRYQDVLMLCATDDLNLFSLEEQFLETGLQKPVAALSVKDFYPAGLPCSRTVFRLRLQLSIILLVD